MKLQFITAAAILLVAIPASAQSVRSVGEQPSQTCSNAAATASLSDRARDRAMQSCNIALAGDLSQTDRAGTLINRGVIQIAAGNDAAAMADFDAGLSHDAGLAAGYMNRGSVELRTAHYGEARADFDRAIALNAANLHVAYFNRGEAEEASGNLMAAYRDYRQAQRLAPDFQPAQTELARFQVNDRRVAANR